MKFTSLKNYFESGWIFFIPYVLLYSLFYLFPLPVSLLRVLFWLLHVATLSCFLGYVVTARSRIARPDFLFWLLLFIALFLPGVYLEFPSDPWEHFRRIVYWNNCPTLRDHYTASKFSYFWFWTFLSPLELPHWRYALDFISAFTQFTLCYQFYRFIRALGIEKPWAKLHTLGFLFLFGTNLFGIRYYALSSTPLAMVGLFAALRLIVQGLNLNISTLLSVTSLGLLMVFNHPQTLVHLCLLSVAFYFQPFFKKKYTLRLILSFLFTLGLGFLLRKYFGHLYSAFDPWEINALGFVSVFKMQSRYMETLGFHGLLSLIFAILYFKRHPLLASFSLVPIFSLLFPPTVAFFSFFLNKETLYRILFAFPLSVILIESIRLTLERINFTRRSSLILTALVLLVISAPYQYPWRGRLRFQLAPTPLGRDYRWMDKTALWLKENVKVDETCRFITDDISGFIISALLARTTAEYSRLYPVPWSRRVVDTSDNLAMYIGSSKICGMLILKEGGRQHEIKPSWVATHGKHWYDGLGDIKVSTLNLEQGLKLILAPLYPEQAAKLKGILDQLTFTAEANRLPTKGTRIDINEDYYFIKVSYD